MKFTSIQVHYAPVQALNNVVSDAVTYNEYNQINDYVSTLFIATGKSKQHHSYRRQYTYRVVAWLEFFARANPLHYPSRC